MNWAPLTVEWKRQAEKDLRGLAGKDKQQIRDAVNLFASTGQGDVKKLQDGTGYRIRVRERRVFIDVVWADRKLFVLAVKKRGDAY